MNKTIRNLSLIALAFAGLCSAQSVTTQTTLASAQSRGDQTITLTSGTGVSAAGLAPVTGIYVDREYETVLSPVGTSTTVWNVKRGVVSIQTPHVSGAIAFVSVPGTFDLGPNDRTGSCTATTFAYLPLIMVRTGSIVRCSGGAYVVGTPLTNTPQAYTAFATIAPPKGIATTSVAHVDGTIWFAQIRIPNTTLLTGACQLNGATVTTDNTIVALYDSGGVLLANSAVAGAADTSNASIYQCQAFLTAVVVPGPATYYAAIQTKGTTDNFQAYAAGGAPTNYGTQSQTGTFGTLAKMTTPTVTFTADKGPLMIVY